MMGNNNSESQFVESRGAVDIIFSTTSGSSKAAADNLQGVLEENKYLASITNIGDYNHQELIGHHGIVIFLLSTYGDGSSPSDGESFLQWIQSLQAQNQFSQLRYAILALGSKSFENHCGFGLKTEKALKKCGAIELMEITLCDASSEDRNVDSQFPGWSAQLVEKLNELRPIQKMPRSNLGSPFTISLESKPNFDWKTVIDKSKNVGKQFMTYWDMQNCKVIHIKQLRKKTGDRRSTLWVRLAIDQNMHLTPGCNIDVFPVNSLRGHPDDQKIVYFSEVKGKVPFPPMPLREIRKLIDYRQKANNKQMKAALFMSTCDPSKASEFEAKLKAKECQNIAVSELIHQLEPKLQFIASMNMNRVRPYTLASWDPNMKYIDLVVAVVPNGLTSQYFKSYPEYIRIRPITSSFYIPEDRPIVMIANGSGIAPFRSIVHHIASFPEAKRPKMRLYFGIQSEQVDYYFEQEWLAFQKQKLIELRIAESRKNPHKKVYVQQLVEEDVDWIQEHLFRLNGVIFICGGQEMSREVTNSIFKAITAELKVPYKAFSTITQLKHNKTIVEEVFG